MQNRLVQPYIFQYKVYLAKKMLEQKGREMLMKDNLIDLNFKSKGDQESEVINDLKNGKAIFLWTSKSLDFVAQSG